MGRAGHGKWRTAAARGDRVEICVSTIFSRGAFLEPAERLLESKCKIQRRGGLGMLHRKVRIRAIKVTTQFVATPDRYALKLVGSTFE